MSKTIAIVWFKRDLRIADHQALFAAANCYPILPLYVIEDDYWRLPDTALRHWQFIEASLLDLQQQLTLLGQGLAIYNGNVIEVFKHIQQHFTVKAVYSHQETGNLWTYRRDQQVASFLRQQHITWHQYPQFGVLRGPYQRQQWAKHWHEFMEATVIPTPKKLACVLATLPVWQPPLCQTDAKLEKLQRPSRAAGLHCLATFLNKRGQNYAGGISSPLSAWQACSRLSPYLSYGLLSMREIYQATCAAIDSYKHMPAYARPNWLRSLTQFQSRLHWHCHFIQKLEVEPDLEQRNMLSLADGLRPNQVDQINLFAWQLGLTGYPFIDACMRALRQQGWINFRMRAMLVSFASYQLWLDWRHFAPYLARLFVDYEPGIHYPQIQMQSGTTGINAMRVYNPVKQSQEQDADGEFIKAWLPELKLVENDYIHEPWNMNLEQQQATQCLIGKDYPAPIVDNKTAMRFAKDKVYGLRKHPDFAHLAKATFNKHGSRKRRRSKTNA